MIAAAAYDLLLWLGLMLVLLMGLGAVVMYLRRRAVGKLREDASAMSIEQLEQLRTDGVISDEEFRRLRRVVMGLPEKTPAAPSPSPADAAAPPEKKEGDPDTTPPAGEAGHPAEDPPPGDDV